MLSLLTSLALAQDLGEFELGESIIEAPTVINPAVVAEEAAAEQATLDSFYDDSPEATSSLTGVDTSWAWVGGFLLLGVAFAARKKLTRKLVAQAKESQQLEVIARHSVGHGAGLVMLDCKTGDGGNRRILVGVSQNGAPTLVADLGGEIPGFIEVAESIPEPVAEPVPVPAFNAAPTPEPTPVVATPAIPETSTAQPKRALVGRFTDADLAPLDDSPLPNFDRWEKTAGPRNALSDHLSLVDEVLAGRQVWEAHAG